MNLVGNIIWIIFGGFMASVGYLVAGLLLCLSIVGIPFGLQCFKLAYFVLVPFGKEAVNAPHASGYFSLFANIIWILCGGWYTALNHIFWAVVWAITIIGIPFARQHLKLLEISLMPFGKKIVDRQ